MEQAQKDVPVDEGVLRDSLTIDEPETNNRGEGSIRVFASQRKDGYHAHLIEFGTSQHRAQPFLATIAHQDTPKAARRVH